MATRFAEVITQWGMQVIDDINWSAELAVSPARFLRAKSDTLIHAVSLFNRPVEAQEWLKFTEPVYDDVEVVVTEGHPVIETGKTGFEICSAVVNMGDGDARRVQVTYDPETGYVTLGEAVEAGTCLEIDFYTDGVFENELSLEMKRILGMCMGVVWFQRFANTWLNLQPKVHDKTFDTGSESAQTTAYTARLKEMRLALNDALLKFEEALHYRQNTFQKRGVRM